MPLPSAAQDSKRSELMTWNEWQAQWLLRAGWIDAGRLAAVRRQLAGRPDGALGDCLLAAGLLSAEQLQELRRAEAMAQSPTVPGPGMTPFQGATPFPAGVTPGPSVRPRTGTPDPGSSGAVSRSGFTGQERLTPGMSLGGYLIEEELSRGGMGVVFKGRSPDGASVAIKVIQRQRPGEREVERFKREALVLTRLSHPGIVRVRDYGTDLGRHFLVMELVAGPTLEDFVVEALQEPAGRPELAEVLEIFESLAGALAYCHEMGVAHRDLKPENVILDQRTGRPVLVDFGLVKALADGGGLEGFESGLSRTGEMIGTPAWMSPEQLEGREVGAAADAWSFGALAYYCCSGERPFEGSSRVELQAAIVTRRPPPLRRSVPALPRELDELIGRCFEPEPERRPGLKDLERGLARRRLQAPRGRWSVLAAGAALATLTLLVALAGLPRLALEPAPGPSLTLEPLPEPARTRASSLTLRGRVEHAAGAKVVSADLVVEPDPNGGFALSVPLTEGENAITVELRMPDGKDVARRTLTMIRDTTPPVVALDAVPAVTCEDRVVFRGRVQEPGCVVTVAGQPVALDDKGLFEVSVSVELGERRVELVARDALGNRTRATRTIERLPLVEVSAARLSGERALLNFMKALNGPHWIRFQPGRYIACIAMSGGHVYEGRGANPTDTVLEAETGDTLRIFSKSLLLKNLTLRCTSNRPKEFKKPAVIRGKYLPAALRVHGSAVVEAEDCVFRADHGEGVSVLGPKARFRARRCVFRDSPYSGVMQRGGSRVEIIQGRFEGLMRATWTGGGSKLRMLSSTISRMSESGVNMNSQSEAVVVGGSIEEAPIGILATKSRVEFSGEIRRVKQTAARMLDGGRLHMHDARLTEVGNSGLAILRSTALVERTEIIAPGAHGVYTDGGRIELREVRVQGTGKTGIAAINRAELVVRGSRFEGSTNGGVVLRGSSLLGLEDSRLVDSELFGIQVFEGATVTLSKVSIRGTRGPALMILKDGRARLFETDLSGNMSELTNRGGQLERLTKAPTMPKPVSER